MKAHCVPILLLLALAIPGSARRHALLIANNLGVKNQDTLRYAESDAQRFMGVLTDISGFDKSDIVLVTPCDSAGLATALEGMRRKMAGPGGADDLFLFYYSGHSDREGLNLAGKRYPLESLKAAFRTMPGRMKIGVFDACQSGFMTRTKGGTVGSPISLGDLKDISGQVIIASSASDEGSLESDELKSGVFTHHWINGLRGSADISGDRKVTLNEAYQYAYQMTIQTSTRSRGGIQHPAYKFQIHGEGDVFLSDLNQGGAGVAFTAPAQGKFLVVEKERNLLLADFYKAPGKEVRIALPKGSYRVLKIEGQEWLVSDIGIQDGFKPFEQASLRPQPQVVGMIKGSLKEDYVVTEGPLGPTRTGAAKRFGFSVKIGESAGGIGMAYIYNHRPELQLQGGGGFSRSTSRSDSSITGSREVSGNYFGLVRRYEGPYFADAGLNLKTSYLSVSDSSGGGSDYGWEMGVPVHIGLELGPRRSIFATLSLGYLWVFTGGGDLVKARTPGGALGYVRTAQSGMSLGFAVGGYIF
jgi:hypothetical protein